MDSKNLRTTFSIQNSLQKIHLADSTPRYSLSFTGAAPTAAVKPRTALHIGSLQTDSDELWQDMFSGFTFNQTRPWGCIDSLYKVQIGGHPGLKKRMKPKYLA